VLDLRPRNNWKLRTPTRDLKTSTICVLPSLSRLPGVASATLSQTVACDRNVNVGPSAGFAVVFENAESGFRVGELAVLFST
jgi:hypothetical protein